MSHRARGKSQAERLNALRSSVDERINNICHDRSEWVNICRRKLLEMETRNIHRRAKHWTEKVNEKIKEINSRLNLDSQIFSSITKKFQYNVDSEAMKKHLAFLISWRGLKTRQIQNAPKTYLQFENKAKNWLNGRRAPNYAATLFPEMIKKSEIYAERVSRRIFANNPTHLKMYCKICIIGFLSSLCSARISLNDASKKAYLICENSVKTGKTAVSQILQRYASDHPYQDKFPSHLREASDFFENKYMELVSDFGIELTQKKRQEQLEYAKNAGGCVLDIINQSNDPNSSQSQSDSNNSVHSGSASLTNNGAAAENGHGLSCITHSIMKDITSSDGNLNAISMSIDQFNKLAQFLSGMVSNQKTQQSTINDLVTRVQHLETQQQKMLAEVCSNTPRSMDTPQFSHPSYSNNTDNSNNSNNSNNSSNMPQYVPIPPTAQRQQQLPPQPLPQQPHLFVPKIPKTTDRTQPNISPQQAYHINNMQPVQHMNNIANVQNMSNINMNMHPRHINMNMHMNRINNINMNNNAINNVLGVAAPQMNPIASITNITNLPVPHITNINMNRIQNNNNQYNNINVNNGNGNVSGNNNVNLPTTSLFGGVAGVTSLDSNDGDANMFGFGNNQSFNSSDGGMANINNSNHSNHLITLDPGYGIPRFSDQSLNFQNIGQFNGNQ